MTYALASLPHMRLPALEKALLAMLALSALHMLGATRPIVDAFAWTRVLLPLAFLVTALPVVTVAAATALALYRKTALGPVVSAGAGVAVIMVWPVLVALIPSPQARATALDGGAIPHLGRDATLAVVDQTDTSYRATSRCDAGCVALLTGKHVGGVLIPRAWDGQTARSGVIYRLSNIGTGCDEVFEPVRGRPVCLARDPAPMRYATHVLSRASLTPTAASPGDIGLSSGTRIRLTEAGPGTHLFQKTWSSGRAISGLPLFGDFAGTRRLHLRPHARAWHNPAPTASLSEWYVMALDAP